jgi:deoxyadenosine/deoxycytidine kinase
MKPIVICIDGIIGAGKSTVTRRLKHLYKCYEEPVDKWTLLPKLYSNMKEYAAPFQFQVLFSQHDQYLSFKNIHDTVIVERCPWTSKNVFASMLIEDGFFDTDAIETYYSFHELLAYDVDHFIFLNIEAELAYERIKKRDRFAEQNISFTYLQNLKNQYEKSLKCLEPSSVTYVNGSNSIEQVESEVKNAIIQVIENYRLPDKTIII